MLNENSVRINPGRFLDDFKELSQFGRTEDGGVNRPTFSDAHLAARRWFKGRIEQAGLRYRTDPAGNCSAVLACANPDAPTLLMGSHLDSVYQGGRFDGALGVLAALEALRTIKESNIFPPLHLEAIDFADEEGTLVGMLGSKALTGNLTPADLVNPGKGRAAFEEAILHAGLDESRVFQAARDPKSLAGYLELHIEQGPNLARQRTNIGVVTGIVGMRVERYTFHGRANHAGTTAMPERRDAGLGASAFHLHAFELVKTSFPGCTATVGQMEFLPGGTNIVPQSASLSLDYRSIDNEKLNAMENAFKSLAQEQARLFNLAVEAHLLLEHHPAHMHPVFQETIAKVCTAHGLSHEQLPSGAGHDAQNLAAICPSGMIFIPSMEGISHSGREFSHDQDCINGANVLLHCALKLANKRNNLPVSS